MNTMYETGADFTNSFRSLNKINLNGLDDIDKDVNNYLEIILAECCSLDEYKKTFKPNFPKE